jgi:hypothetical protein
MATSAIEKEERAEGTLACLHLREILPTDQVSHGDPVMFNFGEEIRRLLEDPTRR